MELGGGKGRFSRLSLLLHPLCVLKGSTGLLQRVVESLRWLQVAPGLFQVHCAKCAWLAEPPVAGESVLVVGVRRGKGFRSKLEVWIMLGCSGR